MGTMLKFCEIANMFKNGGLIVAIMLSCHGGQINEFYMS